MTVIMLELHDPKDRDAGRVHEARIESALDTVGVTKCGLLFDLPDYIKLFDREIMTPENVAGLHRRLVVAREVNTAPTCLHCIADDT